MTVGATVMTGRDMEVVHAQLIKSGTVLGAQKFYGGLCQFLVWPDAGIAGSTLGTDTFTLQMSPDEGVSWLNVGDVLSANQQASSVNLQRCYIRLVQTGTSSSGVQSTLRPVSGQ